MPRQNKFKGDDNARRTDDRGKPERFTADYKRYIYCNLPPADKRKLSELTLDHAELLDWAISLAEGSYKLSTAPSRDGSSITAQLFCIDRNHRHAGCILSAFGKDAITALKVLWYKHTQVLKEDWFLLSDDDDNDDFG